MARTPGRVAGRLENLPGSGRLLDRPPRLAALGLILGLGLVTAPGCVGPRSLELTRLRYDQAVHETTEQQWLRNIVRLRYGELPTFLDVSAITSQFELSSRGSVTGGRERASPNLSLFGDLGLQFRDAPTLSYTPRDPTELTRAMVAPVGITALGLVANNGWNLDVVLRLMVAELNGVENAPGAEQLLPESVPPITPFPEVARLAASLRHDRAIALVAANDPETVSPPIEANRVNAADLVQAASHKLEFRPGAGTEALVLVRPEKGYRLSFSAATHGQAEVEALREFLRLSPGRTDYPIRRLDVPGRAEALPLPLPGALDAIEVQTRTLLEMLIVLSKGVRLPEEHLCKGRAAQVVGPDGAVFDWTAVTRDYFQVCVQKKRPKEAAVAIEYQGYWYSIPANDMRSKATLALIQALFNLQLSEPRQAGPLLTLPVGL